MYEYSFLNEWVGHTASALGGMYYGGKFGYKIGDVIGINQYKKYLNDDANVEKEAVDTLRYLNESIQYWKNRYLSLLEYEREPEKEDIEDPSVLEYEKNKCLSHIKDTQKEIVLIRKLISGKKYDELRTILTSKSNLIFGSCMRTKKSQEIIDTKRECGGLGGTVIGGVAGGIGYHYAKKGIKALLKK